MFKQYIELIIFIPGPGYFSRYTDTRRASRYGDRIPLEVRFSALVQTGPGTHLISYTVGIGYLQSVKRAGYGTDQPTPSSPEAKERVELNLNPLRLSVV